MLRRRTDATVDSGPPFARRGRGLLEPVLGPFLAGAIRHRRALYSPDPATGARLGCHMTLLTMGHPAARPAATSFSERYPRPLPASAQLPRWPVVPRPHKGKSRQ